MSTLEWSEELAVAHPTMDATHQEFIVHLQTVQVALATVHDSVDQPPPAAALDALVSAFDAMIEHTVEHFGQEDRWMLATGFTPENCHSLQHKQVLELLREVRRRLVDKGELSWMERLMPELIQWFIGHAQAADAGLAYHLREVGYDTDTGTMRPKAHAEAPAEAISGCGTSACAH